MSVLGQEPNDSKPLKALVGFREESIKILTVEILLVSAEMGWTYSWITCRQVAHRRSARIAMQYLLETCSPAKGSIYSDDPESRECYKTGNARSDRLSIPLVMA
jgi:hypothetical protein